MVTMTVFISDVRHGDRFTEIRKEVFRECFPASALIIVHADGIADEVRVVHLEPPDGRAHVPAEFVEGGSGGGGGRPG